MQAGATLSGDARLPAPPGPAGGSAGTATRPPFLLKATLVATLALSPLEGYLQDLNGNLSKLAPALFMITWFVHRVFGNRPIGASHPVVWCALGLVPVVLASTAVNLDNGFAQAYLIRWLPFLLLVVALVDVLSTDVDPWSALNALIAGAAASALGAVVSFIVLGSPRATGPLEDPNDLAYVITAAVPLVVAAVRRVRRPAAAIGWGLVLALLLVGAAATLSRGGALATTAVVAWGLSRGLIPVRFLATAAVLIGIVAVPAVVIAQDVVKQALAQKQYIAGTNVDTRLLRWQAAARMLAENPLLGRGPGGFRSGYVEYSGFAELAERQPVAHEMYLEVGAELGAIGLLLFLGAMAAGFAASENGVRRRRADAASDRDGLLLAAFAVQGSLLAVTISSVFLSEQYYMPLWAGLAVAAAVDLRSRTESP